jgi:hypothetical protein
MQISIAEIGKYKAQLGEVSSSLFLLSFVILALGCCSSSLGRKKTKFHQGDTYSESVEKK